MNLIKNRSFIICVYIFFLVLLIYIIVAGRCKFYFPTDPANYFSHLSLSLLNGRLDLINPSWDHDLSIYKGKLYTYWGPTPILLILPIIYIFGVNISDILYTAILSSSAPVIIYLFLGKMEELNLIQLSNIKKVIISLFFAFGTVYFSIAVRGGVWFTSQAVSTLYMLIALYLLLSYSVSKKILYLIITSLFFGLAVWGRSTFIFYTPLFIAVIYIYTLHKLDWKLLLNKTIPCIIVLIIILLLVSLFNYSRFGSIFESGYKYQNLAYRFTLEKSTYGYFNPAYIGHNFYYTFINPPIFSQIYPFIKFDPEGNSFLILSPLFLLIPLIFKKKYWESANLRIFNIVILFCMSLIILIQLNFWGTGWFQFNARYLLDIIPLLIILLAQISENLSLKILLSLIIVSILFNTAGALWLIGVFP